MSEYKDNFSKEERELLELLKKALLSSSSQTSPEDVFLEQASWSKIIQIAQRHSVLSLLYDVLAEQNLPDKERRQLEKVSRSVVLQSYRLLYLSRYLIEKLEKEGIEVVLLKGVAASARYPIPELRKSGDVDLLLPRPEVIRHACALLEEDGFKIKEEQRVLHHIVCQSSEGIEVELHTMLSEPFADEEVNAYLRNKARECSTQTVKKNILGVELTVLQPAFEAYELLLHMLQHFLRSGFGLKLLCDWVVFWNQGIHQDEQEAFVKMIEESKIRGFADLVTAACITYLGLEQRNTPWLHSQPTSVVCELMREILDAEEFGKSQAERMVAMGGSGARDFAREFHHQMKLNFPMAGRVILFWPALWAVTLGRFLYNNARLRRVSSLIVIRKAGERSQLIRHMRLFKR